MRTVLLASMLTLVGSSSWAQAPVAPLPVVVAEGQATVKRAPDRAWISVAVDSRDPKPAEARRRNAEAMKAVQDVLKSVGIAANAIRTTGFSLTPEMEWRDGRGVLRGYVVHNQIEVRVDQLDRLPDVLDAVNSPKGVALSVIGPRFDLKDEALVQQEALRLAVEAAVGRAQAMAAGARRSLGQIVRIDEQGGPRDIPQPMIAMRAAATPAEAQTPVVPGEIEVHARVTVTAELK